MHTFYRSCPSLNPKGLSGGFYRKPFGFFPAICLAALLLAGCGGGSESQATLTAQARRNALQGTRLAEGLQDTDQAKIAGVTATHQANRQLTAQAELDQQATIDANAATEQAYAAERTAEALELQQYIESAKNWPALVADLFDQPAYEWPIISETFPGGSITWSIEAGKYRWTASGSKGFAYWIYPTSQPVSDFYLAVEVQNTGGSIDSEGGLIFHVNERDYWCYLISGEDDLFFGLRVNGEWYFSMPMGSSHVRGGGPNHLAVINQNSQYLFLINGFNLISIGNSNLPLGPAGLMINLWDAGDQTNVVKTTTWEYDNFELRVPETAAPSTTPTP